MIQSSSKHSEGVELMDNEPQFIQIDFPGFNVVLCSFGASIYSIKVNDHDMIVSFKDKDNWLIDNGYHGKTVGRVAGRIPYGSINVKDKIYHLDTNEREHTLHGGYKGLSFQNFNANVTQYNDYSEVIFEYHSPNMECGFPGNVDFQIIYKVYKDKYIEIFHNAKTDEITPISLTQHLYFNLGENNLDNIFMKLKANKRFLLNDDLLKQSLVDVKNTSYDFNKGKLVMEDAFKKDVKGPRKNGFDDIWYLGKTNKNKICAMLSSPRYKAEFYTDYDASVIYMDGYPSHEQLLSGIREEIYGAITMELTNKDVVYVTPEKPYNKYTKIVFKEL